MRANTAENWRWRRRVRGKRSLAVKLGAAGLERPELPLELGRELGDGGLALAYQLELLLDDRDRRLHDAQPLAVAGRLRVLAAEQSACLLGLGQCDELVERQAE